MIFGYLSNVKQELSLYPTGIREGLTFLLEQNLAALATGKHEIKGSDLYVSVSEYETEPKEKRRLEAHVKYVDIQYVAEGVEMIGCGPLAEAGEVIEDRLAEKDVIFYKDLARETEIVLTKGMFAIYFPWDVHRPNCGAGSDACKVRKLVVKVAVKTL